MKKPEIMDTTLRDGEQMEGISYNAIEKVTIAKKLFEIGVDRIEVASARAVDTDKEALKEICKLAKNLGRLYDVEVLGFVDYNKSIDWIYECGGRTINILAKGSRLHCEKQLNKSLGEHISDIKKTIEYANLKSMDINIYLEDFSSGILDYKNNKENYVIDIIRELKDLKGVKRIMLPDTLGKLSYFEVGKFIKELKEQFPKTHFDFHSHNDYGLAVANSLEALKFGINGIHTTVNSFGERAGNCSLFEIGVASKDFLKIDFKLKEDKFTELSKFVETAAKLRISPHTPIIGPYVYNQTAGVHADGDSKGGLYKTFLTGERFGKKLSHSYPLGKQSGIKTISVNLEAIGIKSEKDILKSLVKKVRELGENKKIVTQEDLHFLYLDEVGKTKKMPFHVLDAKVEASLNGERKCYLKISLNNEIYEETGTGDGGYDACMKALQKILKVNKIEIPKLIDYNIIIPPGGGTGSLVEAIIEWKHKGNIFKTVGIDTAQTMAAIKATERMVNIVLMRE